MDKMDQLCLVFGSRSHGSPEKYYKNHTHPQYNVEAGLVAVQVLVGDFIFARRPWALLIKPSSIRQLSLTDLLQVFLRIRFGQPYVQLRVGESIRTGRRQPPFKQYMPFFSKRSDFFHALVDSNAFS